MENYVDKIYETLYNELGNFLNLGAIIAAADKEKPWLANGFTRSQWLAGEAGIPIVTANQARDAYLIFEKFGKLELNGMTVGKMKLILPKLKKLNAAEQIELIEKARTMLYNDLRDSLGEIKTTDECEPNEWEVHTYWRCPKNGRRVYTDPTINS